MTSDYGMFEKCFTRGLRLVSERASVWAEIVWRLGYLQLERELSPESWKVVSEAVGVGDATESDIRSAHGAFSFEQSGSSGVSTYVSSEGRWLFIDFDGKREDGLGYVKRPLTRVRNVRTPTERFDEGVRFTPWGQQFVR
ncbi:MAG TPA: hypothetical protein VH063_07595 [Gaiellaceae bacterium]|jgi:hypothetical protein|nr:hypothetical protein [Gaiellaceae bacterium]